ncbi:MerR family transcriptional regulator [Butyrivibrio sp. WCE2006]|uniref:MerR family transcriptional regulator n=1 Tax=Butyrivibrio sp. WCE2006 TaxID=1410611 RepID=UPI003FA42F45
MQDWKKLQQILLFKALEFPLKDIAAIVNSENFDKSKALEQQIELLTLKKEHIENLITLARGLKARGVRRLNFTAFDTKKLDEYSKRAKEQWGKTSQYKEFVDKSKNWTKDDEKTLMENLMQIFVRFGQLRDLDPASKEVQEQVKSYQNFITENMYTCTDEILLGLGKWLGGGGEVAENVGRECGEGTAEFAYQAIRIYCEK